MAQAVLAQVVYGSSTLQVLPFSKMVKYSLEAKNPSKACKAMGVDLRVHYKNTYEDAQALKGMEMRTAVKYLEDVCEKKRCIPFRKYAGCIGRTPQANSRCPRAAGP